MPNEIDQDGTRVLARILLCDRPEPREVRSRPVRREGILGVGLVDLARRQENLVAQSVDVHIARPRVATALGMANRLRVATLRGESLHSPPLVVFARAAAAAFTLDNTSCICDRCCTGTDQ